MYFEKKIDFTEHAFVCPILVCFVIFCLHKLVSPKTYFYIYKARCTVSLVKKRSKPTLTPWPPSIQTSTPWTTASPTLTPLAAARPT